MQTLSQIRAILGEYGLRPKHRYGQNFLHDKNILTRLLDAADLARGELVLEIGPGTGSLTEALIERDADVIACEIDRDLAALIDGNLGRRVRLLRDDCIERRRHLARSIVQAIDGRPFKLIANLPYQIASPLICTLLIEHDNCLGMYITIQREVADRLMASPSTKDYGPLTIIVGALATVERIATVPPSCFWPQPNVTSAMVSIVPAETTVEGSLSSAESRGALARFTTQLFTKRRKKLSSIVGRDRALPDGVSADARPDSLTVAQIVAVWKSIG